MKLLPKKIVQVQVEDQRRAQIEEGVLIAKKVDALREKLADLEKQHSMFVMGIEDNLKEKTEKLFQEIQSRETEIKLLEIKRKGFLKPLDDEWARVREKDATLSNFEANLRARKGELDRKEENISKKGEEARTTLNHIKVREREMERAFIKADQLKIEAEAGYLKMIEQKEKQEENYYKINRELITREKSIESYEFTLKQKANLIEQEEQFIREEKIRLLDQRQTLERAMARIKKKT